MTVRVAGSVIARQRPGTAKGFVFLSMEDETGVANAIITPQIFQENRATIVQHQFLLIEGTLQNQENVISVKAQSIWPLLITRAETSSHDFHCCDVARANARSGGHALFPIIRGSHSSFLWW
jgi:error-prone DNA polymerase